MPSSELFHLNGRSWVLPGPTNIGLVEGEGGVLEGMAIFALPGHFFGMIGVLTDDGVLYLGDCMFGERTLEKYKIPFVYDVGAYKATIRKVAAIPALHYVMSHGEIEAVERDIEGMLGEGMSFEAVLATVCGGYGITLDVGQYALVGSTIRSFLSYLYNQGRITIAMRGNAMFWTRV